MTRENLPAGTTSWTCPPNVSSVTRRVWAPGGGSSGNGFLSYGGSGSGAGAYSEDVGSVTPGTVYACSIPFGGAAGAVGANGVDAADCWFNNATDIMAKGGKKGVANGVGGAGGLASAGFGTIKFSGGSGAAQAAGAAGGGGGSAGHGGAGGNASGTTGGAAGAGTPGGAGGPNAAAGGSPGTAGTTPGSGASGGPNSGSVAGGAGGDGLIQLEYTLSETFTDNRNPSDSVSNVLYPYDPTEKLNDHVDNRIGTFQVNDVYLGTLLIWDLLRPTPFTFDLPSVAGVPYKFIVPTACTSIAIAANGAHGGAGTTLSGTGGAGGAGGAVTCTLPVAPGDVLICYVGQHGWDASISDPHNRGGEPGGAAPRMGGFTIEWTDLGGTGGGFTCIFQNGVLVLVVGAGGGGGAAIGGGIGGKGGDGGGLIGQTGGTGTTNYTDPSYPGHGGGGGTQSAGGAAGVGGTFSNGGASLAYPGVYLGGGTTYRQLPYGDGTSSDAGAGGGGGGYYGGGGGGDGSVPSLYYGEGGGGGGGSTLIGSSLTGVANVQGANSGIDGSLRFTFRAKRDYVLP